MPKCILSLSAFPAGSGCIFNALGAISAKYCATPQLFHLHTLCGFYKPDCSKFWLSL